MAERKSRYREMEEYLTYIIMADVVLFILYLIMAGNGIAWLKGFLAVFCIVLSLLILGYLFITKELLNRRSLWMTTASTAIVICILFSLLLKFPCPKYILPDTTVSVSQE